MASGLLGRSSRTALVLLWPLALLAGACGGPDARYVTSTAARTYFKVPSNWRVFGRKETLAVQGQTLTSDLSARLPLVVDFDADPHPSLRHDISTATSPYGIARVQRLTAAESDSVSQHDARNLLFPIDDLLAADPPQAELVGQPKSVSFAGGVHGLRIVFTVHEPDADFTVDQISLLDAKSETVYVLAVGCATTCYRLHAGTIKRIGDSWTIRN